jgi:hypothetical protein
MNAVPVNRLGGHGRPAHQFKLPGSQPRPDREPNGGSGMDMVILHLSSEAAVPFRLSALKTEKGMFRTDGEVATAALLRGLAALERECRPLPPTVETGRPAFPINRPPRAGEGFAEVATSEVAM